MSRRKPRHGEYVCLMSALNVLRGNPEGEPKIG